MATKTPTQPCVHTQIYFQGHCREDHSGQMEASNSSKGIALVPLGPTAPIAKTLLPGKMYHLQGFSCVKLPSLGHRSIRTRANLRDAQPIIKSFISILGPEN